MAKHLFVFSFFIALILVAAYFSNASTASVKFVPGFHGNSVSAYSTLATADRQVSKKLAQGKFLVAGPRLGDPNFHRTVVLLIRYGSGGAMGLVINRPIDVKLSTILPNIKELDGSSEPLYIGGPVDPTAVLLLVKSLKPPESATPVFDGVYLSSSTEVLRRVIKKPEKSERFRIFAGYAGWAPKQLESECDRGDWYVVDADHQTLFDRKSSEIWPDLIQRISVKWVRVKSRGHSQVESSSQPLAADL